MNYTDLVTRRISKLIPWCAKQIEFDKDTIWYLHPRKGWRRVSLRRLGVKLS